MTVSNPAYYDDGGDVNFDDTIIELSSFFAVTLRLNPGCQGGRSQCRLYYCLLLKRMQLIHTA
jgi:hypothetical protein